MSHLTATKGQRRARTYRNYRGIARTHILPRHARTPLALFAEEDVRALLSEIALEASGAGSAGASPGTRCNANAPWRADFLRLPSAERPGRAVWRDGDQWGQLDPDGLICASVLLSAGYDTRPEAVTAASPDLEVVSPDLVPDRLPMACRQNNACRHGVACCSGCTKNLWWVCGSQTPSWCCACSGQWAVEADYCCSGRNTIGTGGSGWCV